MNESIIQILYILLGWVLGILSPAIVKEISEKREVNNLKKIIFNDLNELKKRLAPLSFQILPRYGKLDETNFEWIKKNSGIDFSKGLEKIFNDNYTPEQVLSHFNAEGLRKTKLVYFKKMHLFAVDSHLMNFGLLDNHLVEKILEIRFYVEAFNEDVDSFREQLNMTFQSGISDTNHKIITKELDNKNLEIIEKSMLIVDKINNILENKIDVNDK